MKKVIIAFIAGALLMFSGQALADTVSQIGKKVDSEVLVYVNGDNVSNAVIIEGKSYVPGRDVAEALGATVEWKGSEGIVITASNEVSYEEIQAHSRAKANVEMARLNIERLQAFIDKHNEEYLSHFNETIRGFYLKEVEEKKIELEEEKEKLAQYEKELEELESTK